MYDITNNRRVKSFNCRQTFEMPSVGEAAFCTHAFISYTYYSHTLTLIHSHKYALRLLSTTWQRNANTNKTNEVFDELKRPTKQDPSKVLGLFLC